MQESRDLNAAQGLATIAIVGGLLYYFWPIVPVLPYDAHKPLERFERQLNENLVVPQRKEAPPEPERPEDMKARYRKNMPALRATIDESENSVKAGLDEVDNHVNRYANRAATLVEIDHGIEKARRVNELILADIDNALKAWGTKANPALQKYKIDLELAVPLYRERAAELFGIAKNASNPDFAGAHLVDAQFCETLANHAERRLRQYFGIDYSSESLENIYRDRMGSIAQAREVYAQWKITLESWPTTFGKEGLASYFRQTNDHLETMRRFTGAMNRMRKNIENSDSQSEQPIEPQANPEPQPEPQPEPNRRAITVRSVSTRQFAPRPRPQLRTATEPSSPRVTRTEPAPVTSSPRAAEPEPVQAVPAPPAQPAAPPQVAAPVNRQYATAPRVVGHVHPGEIVIEHSSPLHGGIVIERSTSIHGGVVIEHSTPLRGGVVIEQTTPVNGGVYYEINGRLVPAHGFPR